MADFENETPFELLVATILSAQCTDERVNMVTPALFKKYPDPAAFAAARAKPVLCVAHVTNRMGLIDGDFEKGAADGAEESLRVISTIASRWLSDQ